MCCIPRLNSNITKKVRGLKVDLRFPLARRKRQSTMNFKRITKAKASCQLSVKFSALCRLSYTFCAICQFTPSRPSLQAHMNNYNCNNVILEVHGLLISEVCRSHTNSHILIDTLFLFYKNLFYKNVEVEMN